jgi:hypothetical protein
MISLLPIIVVSTVELVAQNVTTRPLCRCGQRRRSCRENNSTISARHGWGVAAIYRDQGINGAKGRDKRRGLDRLMHDQQSCCKLRRSYSEVLESEITIADYGYTRLQ